jgi:hypothetical protein
VLWANLDPALAAFALLGRAAQLASTRFVSRNLVPRLARWARRSPLSRVASLPALGLADVLLIGVFGFFFAGSSLGG